LSALPLIQSTRRRAEKKFEWAHKKILEPFGVGCFKLPATLGGLHV
jgi:hypothetical protein